MTFNPQLVDQAKHLLRSSTRVVITNHVNPDGDAMGSALGLAGALRNEIAHVNVVVPNQYPDFLKWMKGDSEVVIFEEEEDRARDLLNQADLIFHLDYNSLGRSGNMEEILSKSTSSRIVIDHHQQPENFADVLFSDPGMSSTCEMIYRFLEKLEWLDRIGPDEAECIYTGIITDTGNFRFSSTTPETHEVAADLLRKGVRPHEVTSRVYDANTPNRLGLLGRTLENIKIYEDLNTAILYLSKDDLEHFSYRKGDTEGFVNYGLSVLGIKFSIFLSEKDGKIKISFRSKGNFDVNQFAREHFNGGGHINAAGGISELSLEDSIRKLEQILPSYAKELKNA